MRRRQSIGHCKYCAFFAANDGECRHSPPITAAIKTGRTLDFESAWPTVDPDDWCGAYNRRPEGRCGSLPRVPADSTTRATPEGIERRGNDQERLRLSRHATKGEHHHELQAKRAR
ncbi:MAG: hypothetical protein ACR2RF_25170 [Geminicoccaceae bacterium]